MLFDDTYRTIKGLSTGTYKDKGSKFLCFAEPVETESEVKTILEKYRKQYHDARHHCYAYALGPAREAQRMNDDGEPSGTAGRPIFGQILSFDVTNIVIVVVRYFGGTKLGVSGLITAYKSAAKEALDSAIIIEKTVNDIFEVIYNYPETNEVMRVIKERELEILESEFTEKCRMIFRVRKKKSYLARECMGAINNVTINYLKTT